MYANNLFNLVEDAWDKESNRFRVNFDHDILPGCIITHGGEVTHETIRKILEGSH
jgi:NAD(P) transhydrogenase subunit alpha